MKKKKSPIGLIIVLLITAAVIILVKHFYIKDFNIISEGELYTCDQPRRMDYTRLLYKYHVGSIVNVRLASEHREKNWYNEEVTWVRENGVNYFELPVEKKDYLPDEQTQEQFFDIMTDKENLPVLLHGSGDDRRVAMLVAAWLRKARGYTAEETISQVKRIIDDRKLTESEIRFIRDLAK